MIEAVLCNTVVTCSRGFVKALLFHGLGDLQGAHCEERLRIEIVNLREQLDTRTEENGRLRSMKLYLYCLVCDLLF